ncbi:MAG: histidine kinase, partial [Gammaproteobacteria bacterium]
MSIWSGAILAIFLSDSWHIVLTTVENAMFEARAYLKKDRALRVWAASHGGVYVLVSSSTQPNPFLRGVPERDIRTPSGRLLTLMNPAYMFRQIMSEFEQDFNVRGHITSLCHYRQ